MLEIAGYNEHSQLGEKSNCINSRSGFAIISPPIKSSLNVPAITSFSSYYNHSVFITENGEIYASGSNEDGLIIGSLPKDDLTKFTKFNIKDKSNRQFYPISSLCSSDFTLYLVSRSKTSSRTYLAYSYKNIDTSTPLFLNIGSFNPVAIFGGEYYAAAIDDEGSVIFIPKYSDIIAFPSMSFEQNRLPNDEACCIAFCDDVIYALGLSGRVYESSAPSQGNKLRFRLVESLKNFKISEISGLFLHCFALCEDGRVFGSGFNDFGRIAIEKEIGYIEDFIEIESLSKLNIKHVYAGYSHSLFQSFDGTIFGCGSNTDGQLLLQERSDNHSYSPMKTMITKSATFCIAGIGLSAVFIDHDPLKSPNRRIKEKVASDTNRSTKKQSNDSTSKSDESGQLKRKIKQLEAKVASWEDAFLVRPNSKAKSDEIKFIDANEENEFYSNPIKIGEGATSITYKVIDTRTNTPICKKVLKYRKGQTTIKDAQNALKEFHIMYNVSHPCICKAIGINISEDIEIINDEGKQEKVTTIALFLEFARYNLSDVLSMKIDNTLKVRIVLDVVHAMNFLHKKGMMHRDLKIDNIMVNSLFETKLVDFNLASISEAVIDGFTFESDSLSRGVGTLAYMSPEMANEDEYTNKTDVYSFGIVLHIMFTGKLPKQSLKDKMAGETIKMPSPSDSISKFCIKLIQNCVSYEPSNRPSFDQILIQMRKNSYNLASGVDTSVLSVRDKELEFIENYKK